jgi:hypothetical protein
VFSGHFKPKLFFSPQFPFDYMFNHERTREGRPSHCYRIKGTAIHFDVYARSRQFLKKSIFAAKAAKKKDRHFHLDQLKV